MRLFLQSSSKFLKPGEYKVLLLQYHSLLSYYLTFGSLDVRSLSLVLNFSRIDVVMFFYYVSPISEHKLHILLNFIQRRILRLSLVGVSTVEWEAIQTFLVEFYKSMEFPGFGVGLKGLLRKLESTLPSSSFFLEELGQILREDPNFKEN